MPEEVDAVGGDPYRHHREEKDDEFPTSPKFGDLVGQLVAETEPLVEFLVQIVGNEQALVNAVDDFLFERGKLAAVLLHLLADELGAETVEADRADEAIVRPIGLLGPDQRLEVGLHEGSRNGLACRLGLAADRAGVSVFRHSRSLVIALLPRALRSINRRIASPARKAG